MKAFEHPRQAERLRALQRYEILDTPREAEFDEIAQLAAEICDVPISVLNLIDAGRQWFKAEVGLGVRETPLETSICSHVILQPDFVEISDTRNDFRTLDNPLCLADNGLRFYAGALLKTEDDLPIGTLCVLDYRPRSLTTVQRRAIEVLARQVMKQLELRLALRRQDLLRREIDHRVRNSLQTVVSLIRLQRARVTDWQAREAFDAVSRRVDSIILLHQELQQSSDAELVNLGRFVTNVCQLLTRSAPENVEIVVRFDEILVNSQQASSVGVIINEFVTNSLKYAFPDGRPGTVRIEGRSCVDGSVEVDCADDGVGVRRHDARAADSGSGLGMRIVEASAGQIGGSIEYRTDGAGYRFVLSFPADRPAPAREAKDRR